jgi:predicted RNA-binding protein (virulence factor B family)
MIDEHINVGVMNKLTINRVTDFGFFLICQDGEEVLLPNAYMQDNMKIDDEIDVFIYTDSEDRIVATTQKPYGFLNDFVPLKVVDVTSFGAFLDFGLPKDLLLPKKFQKTKFEIGSVKFVQILLDKPTDRLYASEHFTSDLSQDTKELVKNQKVTLDVFAITPLGYKVLIDKTYEGILYDNEVFTQLFVGDKVTGYIKQVRKDKKVDVSLQPIGRKNSLNLAESKILKALKENNNTLNFTYKSHPDDINQTFGISKKEYKRALGILIKNNSITIDDDKIILNS